MNDDEGFIEKTSCRSWGVGCAGIDGATSNSYHGVEFMEYLPGAYQRQPDSETGGCDGDSGAERGRVYVYQY